MFGRYAGIRNARRIGALDVPRSASTAPRASSRLTALHRSPASEHQQFRCPKPRDGSRTQRSLGQRHHRPAVRCPKTPRRGRLVRRGVPDSTARVCARGRTASRSVDRSTNVRETRHRACGRSQAAKQLRGPRRWRENHQSLQVEQRLLQSARLVGQSPAQTARSALPLPATSPRQNGTRTVRQFWLGASADRSVRIGDGTPVPLKR